MCLPPKRLTDLEPEPNACRHEHKNNLGLQGHQDAVLGKGSQVAASIACLQVEEQKCSGEVQGLTTVTILVALATFPASSSAVYVTV